MKPPSLVLVEWEDSARPVPTWQFLDEINDTTVVRCQSVGFLIYDGKDTKVLAPNVGEIGTEEAQASGVIRIPTRCVTKMRRVKVGS